MFEKYSGIDTGNRSESKVYDTVANELKESSVVAPVTQEYLYHDRDGEVTEFFKNGETLDPSSSPQGTFLP